MIRNLVEWLAVVLDGLAARLRAQPVDTPVDRDPTFDELARRRKDPGVLRPCAAGCGVLTDHGVLCTSCVTDRTWQS